MEERIRNLEDKIKVLEQDNRDLKLGIKMLIDHHVKIGIAYNQQLYNQVTSRLHSMVNQHAKEHKPFISREEGSKLRNQY